MANAIYPKYKEALLSDDTNISLLTGDVKVILVDTDDYTYSSAHDFVDDVLAAARVSTSPVLTTKTVTNGTLKADNVTFSSVVGDQAEAIIIYIDTGDEATSRLVAYLDTGVTGLPVTPNGGDMTIAWDAAGIFTL